MAQGTIKKKDLKKLVAAASKDARFFGPSIGPEGVSLAEIGADDEISLNYTNLKLPLKRLLFPQSQVIYTYEEDALSDVLLAEGKTVVLGARPCDAHALLHLEKVFLDEQYVDPYYQQRRENMVLISLACSEPDETCFCTSVGGSPAAKEGADILAYDVEDALLFESVTKKGEEFMKAHSSILEKPKPDLVKAGQKQASEAEKKVPAIDVDGAAKKLKKNFDSPVWDEIAEKCLGCGICTYSCPTCHCFGIHDEKGDLKGRRLSVQDSCMFPGFTLEASGHNPRTTRGARMRQRIMHKFRYTAENFGDIFCVGCGRCITNCPVNMDVRETIAEATR